MCGIAGIFSLDPQRPVDLAPLQAMTRALIHRGPDDEGFHLEGGCGLGFRRLAIVDPRPAGNQPHYNPDRSIVSVCNGEIYNHDELRAQLESAGHRLRSRCDVEVLPHLYERHAENLLPLLSGQFALAIHERAGHRLLLARDPVGICPLFWCEHDGQLLFASEIKALLTHPGVAPRVDLAGLDQVLTFPGLVSPRTLFAGIHSLPPGHLLRVEDGRIEVRAYWDLDYPPQAVRSPPPDWEAELEHLLLQAVSRRLQADVPVGFYLSGGLDSSLIAGLIHRLRPRDDWQAFSIVFDDAALDERHYQRQVADAIGARLNPVHFGADQIERRLRAVVRAAETPLRETYDTCSHALSEAVQQAGCKVVLSGEGADELFAGYVGYRFDHARDALEQSGDSDFEDLLDGDAWEETRARETLWGDGNFFYERDYAGFRDTRRALYAPDIAARLAEFDCSAHAAVDPARMRGRHPFHQRSYVDFKLRIADHLLADHGDRMTFAHSVEGRYPFLDPDLIDFVRRLPPELLMHDGREKYPLRQVARQHVPAAILAREKFAFVAPGSPLLLARAASGVADWVADLLDPARIRREGYFNPDTVSALREAYLRPDFSINQTFDIDLMMIVLSFQLLSEEFALPARS